MIDDLAFAMYQDPEIAVIIRNLDRKKQECVHGKKQRTNAYKIKSFEFLRILLHHILEEKFDQARRFKQAVYELMKVKAEK